MLQIENFIDGEFKSSINEEFLDNYNLGSVIDFGDIDQFNNAIHKWAKVDRKKHFKQARKVYEKNFDMKKIAKSMSKYIFDG